MRVPGQLTPDHGAILATLGRSVAVGAGQAQPGTVVRVSGTVQPGPAGVLTAPFSGRPCVWYRTLEVRALSANQNLVGLAPTLTSDMAYTSWGATDVDSPAPFAVADASGEVLVDPARGDLDAPTVSFDDRDRSLSLSTVVRREWILEAGAAVFALGAVAQDIGGRPVLRATPGDCLVVSGRGEQQAVARSQTVYAALGGRRLAAGGTGAVVAVAAGVVVVLAVIVVLALLIV